MCAAFTYGWHQWDLDQGWPCGHISVKLAGLHNPEPVLGLVPLPEGQTMPDVACGLAGQ